MKRSVDQLEESHEGSKEEEFNNDPMKPQKRFFRSRAHCNPLSHNDSFAYPLHPTLVPWNEVYPNIPAEKRIVKILDMGMGFGGLTVKLSEIFPDTLVLGMEIRAKVRLVLEFIWMHSTHWVVSLFTGVRIRASAH